MKRILFVDDNELMREMYEMMLTSEARHWHVTTAASGPAALELMKKSPFDIVVSDMRMPEMDGIALLNEVTKLYPQTSRIIISGISDQAEAADALASTHLFLHKPVDLKTLKGALGRLTGLDALLKDEKLKALAGRMRAVPSFPMLYLEIMEAIEDPNGSLNTVYDLIIKDPGLTAKMLQIVNSVSVGLREKISDPLEAVHQLGLNTVRSLALSAHVFANFTPAQRINFPMDKLWTHLMRTGNTARAIMQAEDAEGVSVDAAYTAGMLHDIGKLMLADSLPKEFQGVVTQATTRDAPFHEIELEVFGATHAGLGAYLLGLWGLPAPIVEAVAFHHTPELSTHPTLSPLTAVHAANALEHELDGGRCVINPEYLEKIGSAKRLDLWRTEARRLRALE